MAEERYQVVTGSKSAHCCFEFTVVDTHGTNTYAGIGGEHEPVCECFEKKHADLIAAALNAYKEPTQ